MILVVGIVVGWWLWGRYGIKTASKVDVVSEKDIQTEVSKPSKSQIVSISKGFIVNSDGFKVDVVQILGQVTSWNPETGVLEFTREGKIWRITIDLSKTMMLVNSIKEPSSSLSVIDKSDPNWKTGFCVGDEVVVMSKNNEVLYVENNGYRTCGNRDR